MLFFRTISPLGLQVWVVQAVCNCLGYFVSSIAHFVFHHRVGCWYKERMHLWMLVDNCEKILWVLLVLGIRLNPSGMREVVLNVGCNHRSANWDMGSVILLQLDTIDLIPIGFLKKIHSLDVCVCLGGLQRSNHVCFSTVF